MWGKYHSRLATADRIRRKELPQIKRLLNVLGIVLRNLASTVRNSLKPTMPVRADSVFLYLGKLTGFRFMVVPKVFQSGSTNRGFCNFAFYYRILNVTTKVRLPARKKSSIASGRIKPSCCQALMKQIILRGSKVWRA